MKQLTRRYIPTALTLMTALLLWSAPFLAHAEEPQTPVVEHIYLESDTNSLLDLGINVDSLIAIAKSYIGVPYRYGGCTPEGFDCSGFVNYVFNKVGLSLPRSSSEMGRVGKEVSLAESCKGDIILFGGSDPKKRPIGHAGIIISDPGEPIRFIHSATSNKQGIVVSVLDGYDYFVRRFVKVVRVME